MGRPMTIKGGLLIYKCRLCGGEAKHMHVPDVLGALVSIEMNGRTPGRWGAMTAYPTDIHNCPDGRLGVSDLQGGEPDATPDE